jgi:basic amino acid/polyamine antiporter, APA family
VAAVPLAIAAIVVLSIVNCLGVKPGSRLLNVLVVLKVAALVILIGAGAFAPATEGWWFSGRAAAADAPSVILAFGAALVPILFAYGGWQNANYVAEEIEDPRRNLPRSLLVGTITVVLIYVAVNVVYLRALGLEGLASTRTPASAAAGLMFGAVGDVFVTAAIAVSTFGFLDLAILAPTRVYYAMAADRVFLPALATLHPRYQTPWLAIIGQSAWSCVLALTGRYEQLLNYVVFADWIFFGLTVATVIVFRRTHPLGARPGDAFRAPGYPLIPIAFVLVAAAVVASVVWADPSSAWRGALLLAAGVPVFLYSSRQSTVGGRQ